MLMMTAWLVLTGTQLLRDIGDVARFSTGLFQILAPLQMALAVFFSALFTASSVSQEKERRTLVLLLMTDLSNCEIVLGRLLASLLNVFVLLFAALPLFVGLTLMGGVELWRILQVFAVTFFAALAAGSLGSTLALWREKSFQALALTVLALVFWIGICEIVAFASAQNPLAGGDWQIAAAACSPWRVVLEASAPEVVSAGPFRRVWQPETAFLLVAALVTVLLNSIAIWRVRLWNPSRELRSGRGSGTDEEIARSAGVGEVAKRDDATAATPAVAQPTRRVWDYPILWREVRTRAYGRRTLIIRAAYWGLAALIFMGAASMNVRDVLGLTIVSMAFFLLSLVLINTQAVTSLSTERDAKTLDLLLVTDVSPKEFVFGKLGGVFYNTKEMVVLPVAFGVYLWSRGAVSMENTTYLVAGLLVMNVFVGVLGIHCGLVHKNSRVAVATSLGTVFFLFVGIWTCMRIMMAFSGSFGYQLAPFLAFMLGGGIGLYILLGARNASSAILWAAFTCPFLTFWAITSFFQAQTLGPFLVASATYVFTTLAMLVPAISEFDLTSGRTTEH